MMVLLGSKRADSFLRAFYTARHGKADGSKLYSSFKKIYDTPAKLFDISIEMRGSAENYNALFSSDDAVWSRFSDKARRSVDALKIIGASQLHPIILSALERLEDREVERVLRLLEVIAVRYQLVRRGRPGRIESLGARAAREVTSGNITKASEVRQSLSELYVSDADFKSEFAKKTERESKKARYLIAGIERQAVLREGKHLTDELRPDAVTLEHIFPKSPSGDWQKALRDDPEFYNDTLLRLGNMCLLTDVNRALGNRPFDAKKEVFSKSRLLTTNSLTKFTDWRRPEIEKRQGFMAELAVAEWRFQ